MQCEACLGATESIGKKFGVPLHLCVQCGSVCADCQEPQATFYEETYFNGETYGYSEGAVVTTNQSATDSASNRRLAFVQGMQQVFELGAGTGSFVQAGIKLGINVLGVERSAHMRGIALREHGVRLHSDIPEMSDGTLALVFVEVIEHIKQPREFLSSVFKSVGRIPDRLLMTTPNGDAVQLLGIGWNQVKPPEHLLLYTSNGLRALVESLGYKAIEFHYYHSVWLDRSIKLFGSRSNRRIPILWGISSFLRYFDSLICKLLPKRYALGLECYCEK